MEHTLAETILAAFMCKQPVVIVEGQDDIKFYDNIASLNDLCVTVQAVETIAEYSEGCEQVCKAMDDAISLLQDDERLKIYVIGIIDRDVRGYLNTLPVNDQLLVFKYYSYETHLITDATIKKILELLTKMSGSLITQNVVDWIKLDFEKQIKELYYFSLEALKGRCDSAYPAGVTYSLSGEALTGKGKQYRWGLIENKIEELDRFAERNGISMRDIKNISNGKWILAAWCDYLVMRAKTLYNACGEQLPQCEFCEAGKPEKCLWRPSVTYQAVEIKNQLYTKAFIDKDEVEYIVEYMKSKLAC